MWRNGGFVEDKKAAADEDAFLTPAEKALNTQNKLHWTAFSLHPGSAPMLISDWAYTPTPEWGAPVKRALAGEQFPTPEKLR